MGWMLCLSRLEIVCWLRLVIEKGEVADGILGEVADDVLEDRVGDIDGDIDGDRDVLWELVPVCVIIVAAGSCLPGDKGVFDLDKTTSTGVGFISDANDGFFRIRVLDADARALENGLLLVNDGVVVEGVLGVVVVRRRVGLSCGVRAKVGLSCGLRTIIGDLSVSEIISFGKSIWISNMFPALRGIRIVTSVSSSKFGSPVTVIIFLTNAILASL